MNESQLIEKIATALYSDIDRDAKKRAILSDVSLYFSPVREPGKARQAAAWLQDRPGWTIAQAARLFGVTPGAVSAARASGPYPKYEGPFADIPMTPPAVPRAPKSPSVSAQAAAWLQDRPFARALDAARLFGVTVGAVAVARQNGPYEAYSGPHNAVPDPVPANLPALLDAIRWFRADEYRRSEKMAAAMFRVRVSDLRRAMYYADREDPDEVPPR